MTIDQIIDGWEQQADIQAYRSALALRGDWQPIETAPKDGTWIVLWVDSEPLVAGWNANDGDWRLRWNDDWIQPPPTHWMPLPTPPR